MNDTTPPIESTHAVTCPRCDYDLDGAVAAFTDTCPLRGTCPECGMDFLWANLLRADRRQLPWLFEHARQPVRGFIGTLWNSLFPGRFWNAVQMWHVPRLARLWVFALLCSGGIVIGVSLIYVAISLGSHAAFGGVLKSRAVWSSDQSVFNLLFYPFAVESWGGAGWLLRGWRVNSGLMLMPIACFWGMNLSWPLMMLVLSDSRRESKVRRAHVLRAWAYSLWWGIGITAAIILLRTGTLISDVSIVAGWSQVERVMVNLRQSAWQWLYYSTVARWNMPICVILLFAWTARWWWVVIVRYWRFSQPGLVYWLIFAVSLLTMLIPGVLGAYDLFM